MRFTNALVAGIFAFTANAQTTESVTSAGSTAVTSVPSATTTRELTPEESLQAEVIECVETCPDDDVDCQANCITVPNPDEAAANDTNACVADCPQGDGSEEESAAYGECVQSCIAEHYLTTTFTGGQPTNTGGSSQGDSEVTATPTPSVSTVTSGSSTYQTTVTPTNTDSPSETESSSETEATDAPNGGALPFSPIGATGLLGLVAAFFAL
ncbi:hypothetical protein DL768_007129 [Monosporascus sp. mg162]|nr:hypothetical protein DL768_007129 [Monosporascus sp. mg162]